MSLSIPDQFNFLKDNLLDESYKINVFNYVMKSKTSLTLHSQHSIVSIPYPH